MRGLGYALGTLVLTVLGQMLLKWRVTAAGRIPGSLFEKVSFLLQLLMDPLVIVALAAALAAACLWMLGLTQFSLSTAYPLMSLSFVLILALGHWLFGERISAVTIVGAAFVVAGVVVIGLGR